MADFGGEKEGFAIKPKIFFEGLAVQDQQWLREGYKFSITRVWQNAKVLVPYFGLSGSLGETSLKSYTNDVKSAKDGQVRGKLIPIEYFSYLYVGKYGPLTPLYLSSNKPDEMGLSEVAEKLQREDDVVLRDAARTLITTELKLLNEEVDWNGPAFANGQLDKGKRIIKLEEYLNKLEQKIDTSMVDSEKK